MFTMKKITFLCVSAFLFAACSKAAPDNSEKKQENATNIESNVQNTNINNGNENNSNITNNPSENSNTLKTFKTEKQDAQLPLQFVFSLIFITENYYNFCSLLKR